MSSSTAVASAAASFRFSSRRSSHNTGSALHHRRRGTTSTITAASAATRRRRRGARTHSLAVWNDAVLIKGGRVVTHDEEKAADVLIVDGRIAAVGADLDQDLDVPSDARVIDADGLLVMPGGIDPHTHMELPFMGTVASEDFFTGTSAAAAAWDTAVCAPLTLFQTPCRACLDVFTVSSLSPPTRDCIHCACHSHSHPQLRANERYERKE